MDNEWDGYLIEGTNVLKNHFSITDHEMLAQKETEVVFDKLVSLHLEPIITGCTIEDLKQVHKVLFEDIYPFAGKIRKCTLCKNAYNFLEPSEIIKESEERFAHYSAELDRVTSKEHLAFVLAPFYYDLIRIHPFREGNGRAIREFVREVVLLKCKNLPFKVELDYTKIDKDNLMLGTRQRYFYPSLLETEFMKGLVPTEIKENDVKK